MMNWRNDFAQYDMGEEFIQMENFQPFFHPQPSLEQFYGQPPKFNTEFNGFTNLDNMAFEPQMNMNFTPGMGDVGADMRMQMNMRLALGLEPGIVDFPMGLDMVCANQCRFPECDHCDEYCETCCECCEDDVVEFNTDYLCPLGFLRVCIIVSTVYL